ncbi:MAG: hypothetical protein GXP35_17670 [Actinobacteria bacterium]|nr:hypothetical protein [Actinomycetota bacterium]
MNQIATGPIETLATAVPLEWIDYNDHMSEGYYGVAFGEASDALLEAIGFGAAYRADTAGTFYTVETRITYEQELPLGEPIKVLTTVIGVDVKRVHLWHELFNSAGQKAATQESLLLHVDQAVGKVSAMGPSLFTAAQRVRDNHVGLPGHREVGKSIRPVLGS